eukprot:9246502-Karenia_brevis.AAC.1
MLWESGRWVHVMVAVGSGRNIVHIMSVYGHSGASVDNLAMQNNEHLLRAVFNVAAELGNVPVIIVGDLNIDPEKSAMVQAALTTGRWVDAEARR